MGKKRPREITNPFAQSQEGLSHLWEETEALVLSSDSSSAILQELGDAIINRVGVF
jgi:hypothetical protein